MLPPEQITATLLRERLALTAYIATVTRDFHLAEDIFQDVCVKAVGKGEDFASSQHVINWARVAGRNRAINALRARDGKVVGLSEEMLAALEPVWPEGEVAQGSARIEALNHCLGRLTPNNKEIVRLRYFEARPCQQVADALGRKIETIYQALARIHRTLADCVKHRLSLSTEH
jgi:RNA polymerase sigma-70 factor (ECF subfamily)